MNPRINSLRTLSCTLRKAGVAGFSAMALLTFAISAQANMVINGGFETTSNGPGQFDFQTTATGWTSTNGGNNAYNFIFASGTGDTTGSNGQYGNVALWGLNNGGLDLLPVSSPDGGNFVAADGAFQNGAIQQTINGLIAGDSYTLSFYWAGAQQSGFTGATTEQWQVTFGSQTQSTVVVDNASQGFTGWMAQTFDFTASNTSQVLSFFAVGTPDGVPPFVLLDGVSLNADSSPAPEPGTLTLMLGGVIGALGIRRLRNWSKSR